MRNGDIPYNVSLKRNTNIIDVSLGARAAAAFFFFCHKNFEINQYQP
jgi:hypothetical protein